MSIHKNALRIVAGKGSVSTAFGYGLVGSKISVNTQKRSETRPLVVGVMLNRKKIGLIFPYLRRDQLLVTAPKNMGDAPVGTVSSEGSSLSSLYNCSYASDVD